MEVGALRLQEGTADNSRPAEWRASSKARARENFPAIPAEQHFIQLEVKVGGDSLIGLTSPIEIDICSPFSIPTPNHSVKGIYIGSEDE